MSDTIGETLGNFGKWQFRAVLLIFLYKIPASWFMACIIFTAPIPKYGEVFCKPPTGIEIQNNSLEWIHFSHPSTERVSSQNDIDFCNVYNDTTTSDFFALNHFNESFYEVWKTSHRASGIKACASFQYATNYQSIITQYDLVCERDILVPLTQFFHLFGILMGGCIAVEMIKVCSPKLVTAIGMVTLILFGVVTGIAPTYEIHVIFRCLAAASCALMFTAGGVIFSDITGGKPKIIVTTLFDIFWSVGVILLPAVAISFTNWTYIYMAITFPTLLLIFLLVWIPDSPRWWLKRGNVEKVKCILQQATSVNGTDMPSNIDEILEQQAVICAAEPKPAGWLEIWQVPFKVKVAIVASHLVWAIYIVNFMGMLVNVRAAEPELIIANTIVCGISEIFGVLIGLWLILKATNYKWQVSGLLNVICGGIGMTAWLVPDTVQGSPRTALMMIIQWCPKIPISTTLALLTTCATEMIEPRKKRMTAYSLVVFARIWLLSAPFICVLNRFAPYTAQTAYSGLCLVGGLITTLIVSSPDPKKT